MSEFEKPTISRIWILPLFGNAEEFFNAVDALAFLEVGDFGNTDFVRIELQVKMSNGFEIDARGTEEQAKEFIRNRDKGLL